ncbi:MAG: carboxypeptidase-like regulatory domain-containing protein, partial [Prevotella sp.]|nr:carboxypeptidase-like regulatory domain-containing protein [Prevotella sp.]
MSGLRKKIKTFLLAVLMALPATVYAQMEEYSSRVVDAETGEPLPMATVQGAAESTVTNIEGLFSVKADAGDVLKISYIGYKSVSIKASDIKTRIRLKLADIQLKEIEVKPFTSTLRKIVKKSISALSSNAHRRANYLYRQTTAVDGVTSSMVEAFFNANSAYNVCGMAIITGSYSQSDKDTDSTLSYIASLYPLSEIAIVQNERVPLAYSLQLMPLNMDYDRYYDVSHETIDDGERKIYSIEFKPKGNYDMMVFDGKLFVDAQTLRLLKAEGRLLNVKVETDYNHFYAGVLSADVGFTVCFNEKSKYGEVQSVCISAEFKDMMHSQRFSSILYNVGDRNVGRAKWTRRKEDLRLQIDRMGYDKQFWRDNEIVKRTAVEAELARLREENFDKPNDKTTVSPTKEERTNDGKKPADNGYGNKNYKDLATADSIQKYFSLVQQERVYMHFDNTSYYKGDSIWFKAYVVGERDLKNINASKILYVELVNPYGIPVETKKLVISRGQAHGCMALADTINAGYYEVRAYTSWMLNFCRGDKHGNPFFYQKRTKDILGNHYQRFLYNNMGIYSRVFPVYDAQADGNYQ